MRTGNTNRGSSDEEEFWQTDIESEEDKLQETFEIADWVEGVLHDAAPKELPELEILAEKD